MAKSLNQCNFIGNITKDIDLRYAPSGAAVANFSIACNDSYKTKEGEQVDAVEFVNIVAFGKLAEIMNEYLKKGSKVYISGKFKTSEYDKEGQTHYNTKIEAKEMLMLDNGNNASSGAHQSRPESDNKPEANDEFNDDIPF